MDSGGEMNVMTAEAAPRLPKDQYRKKSSGKPANIPGKIPEKKKEALYAVSEHSLSGFMNDEPDLYSVADLRVRYR
jgi:hypothetical protein